MIESETLQVPGDVELVEQSVFEANLDYYLDAAETGQEFWLVRDGKPVCRLRPAST
ncbi:MAG TPA: hypothetical protein VJM34_02760 [Novosphingobium sp.]|nr:hypothetical protein [Novosphingobium sp.]